MCAALSHCLGKQPAGLNSAETGDREPTSSVRVFVYPAAAVATLPSPHGGLHSYTVAEGMLPSLGRFVRHFVATRKGTH